jgi:hypothetical protein
MNSILVTFVAQAILKSSSPKSGRSFHPAAADSHSITASIATSVSCSIEISTSFIRRLEYRRRHCHVFANQDHRHILENQSHRDGQLARCDVDLGHPITPPPRRLRYYDMLSPELPADPRGYEGLLEACVSQSSPQRTFSLTSASPRMGARNRTAPYAHGNAQPCRLGCVCLYSTSGSGE